MRKRRNRVCLIFLPVLLFVAFGPALASQEVIYKDTRPMKKVFEDEKDTDKQEDEQGLDKGFVYNPTGKTDPFKSFIAIREEKEAKKDKKPKTYLETLELSQLALTVIVVSKSGKWAMVRDSKGIGHVIKEGTAIGTNGGVVYKILKGEVVVREEYKDFRGKMQFRDISKKSPSLR